MRACRNALVVLAALLLAAPANSARLIVTDSGGIEREVQRLFVTDGGAVEREIQRLFVIDSGGTARLVFFTFEVKLTSRTGPSALTASQPNGGSNATCGIRLNSNGLLEQNINGTFSTLGTGEWGSPVVTGVGADYDVTFDRLAGTVVWLNLATTRSTSIGRVQISGPGTTSETFLLAIRPAGGGSNLAVADITCHAVINP